jgi:hypothetical protein
VKSPTCLSSPVNFFIIRQNFYKSQKSSVHYFVQPGVSAAKIIKALVVGQNLMTVLPHAPFPRVGLR